MADTPIRLKDLVAHLRQELAEAQRQGQGQEPRFTIDEATVELQVVLTSEQGVEGGVKVWVLHTDLKDKTSEAVTQKLTLKLKPTTRAGAAIEIAATETPHDAPPAPRPGGMRARE